MNGVYWLMAAALAGAEVSSFPCDKLRPVMFEVYEGFEPAPAPPGPVKVKRKAVLYDGAAPLIARDYMLAEPTVAADKAILFHPYREGQERLLCTNSRSDALFGAGDEAAQFMLRCLVDADGDGRFEAFSRRVELFPFGKDGKFPNPPPTPAPVLGSPLPRPVTLVEKPGPALRAKGPYQIAARSRIVVSRVEGNQVELSFSGEASIADRLLSAGEETVYAVPMADGAVVPIGGTRIRFARRGSYWTAEALDGFGRAPRLHCSGSVAEVGDTFTLLGASQQTVITRASLAGAH